MNEYIPRIEKPGDLEHPRTKSLLSEYNIPIEELHDLNQQLYKRGEFKLTISSVKKDPSIMKELVASAILYLQFTKRDRFLIPIYEIPLIIQFNGQKKFEYLFSFIYEREKSIDWYNTTAKKFLKDAKRIKRCLKHRYLGYLLWWL
jgi:hypothetical protein